MGRVPRLQERCGLGSLRPGPRSPWSPHRDHMIPCSTIDPDDGVRGDPQRLDSTAEPGLESLRPLRRRKHPSLGTAWLQRRHLTWRLGCRAFRRAPSSCVRPLLQGRPSRSVSSARRQRPRLSMSRRLSRDTSRVAATNALKWGRSSSRAPAAPQEPRPDGSPGVPPGSPIA